MKLKKTLRVSFIILLTLMAAVLVNTILFVFVLQGRSVEKLSKAKDLSLYECCSIYATHLTMSFVGYPIAPEAARECINLHFTRRDTVYFKRQNFSGSEKLKEGLRQLSDKPDGSSVRIAWNANSDYSPFSKEHRLAIATNPCTLTKVGNMDEEDSGDNYRYRITASIEYPIKARAEFNFGAFRIVINEGLFRYLQDKGWLHRYIAVYNLT